MTTVCDCCEKARSAPLYAVHCPRCLHCGARLIRNILRLPIARSEAKERAKAMLKVWTDAGHSETEIRRLLKLEAVPLAPESLAAPKKNGA